MTAVAAGVSGPFFQQDGLHFRFEGLETEGVRRCRSRLPCWRAARSVANPGREYLPFSISLGLPELAARVSCVAARFLRKRMEQKTAAERIVGRHQLGNERKILTRLCFCPGRITGQEGLQPKASGKRGMTVVAAHSAFPPLEKNRLDERAVLLVAERRLRLRACRRALWIRLWVLNRRGT